MMETWQIGENLNFGPRRKILSINTCLLFLISLVLLYSSGCAPKAGKNFRSGDVPNSELLSNSLQEIPQPEGKWRPQRVSWCEEEAPVSVDVEKLLSLVSQYFREGSGPDGMLELEYALQSGTRHPLILLTLGQLYLMAGQGEPDLLPPEGPAADVGDWDKNKIRLLNRAENLFLEATSSRPADAALDYLRADVARAQGDLEKAGYLVASGHQKCTSGRGFSAMIHYQQLFRHPGRYLGGPGPVYPAHALKNHIEGDVVLDLLISPAGEVRQAVAVQSPDFSLSRAAATSMKAGNWDAGRIGKYPIWSWLRVTTSFTLD